MRMTNPARNALYVAFIFTASLVVDGNLYNRTLEIVSMRSLGTKVTTMR